MIKKIEKTKPGAAKTQPDPSALQIDLPPGKSEGRVLAEVCIDPASSAASLAQRFHRGSFGDLAITDIYGVIRDQIVSSQAGDQSAQRAMLVGQSIALNAIFAEMARRAALNMGEYIGASETYMRLALKAQAQSRATVEALDRLANGHEQTVRHVHVDNRGGQAVIAETYNQGGGKNEEGGEQSYGPNVAPPGSPAMLGQDEAGNGVPIPSDARPEPVPHPRRREPRPADREPQRL